MQIHRKINKSPKRNGVSPLLQKLAFVSQPLWGILINFSHERQKQGQKPQDRY